MSEVARKPRHADAAHRSGVAERRADYECELPVDERCNGTLEGFDVVALGDVAHLEMGQSPDSRYVSDDMGVGVPFLQGNAEFSASSPQPRFSCTQPAKMCREGDLLISVRAPVGEINLADRDYCIGRGLAAIRLHGMPASLAAQAVIAATPSLRRVAQGTTFDAISKSDLSSLAVQLPPAREREVLARIVDTLDTTIRQTEAIIAKLKQVKQGLLHDLLTRGIDANGELRPPQSEAPHLYQPSPIGHLPREWEVERLCQRLGVYGGKRLPAGHDYIDGVTGYKYLRVTDFYKRKYRVSELENLSPNTFLALNRYEIAPDELCISIAGSLGYACVHGFAEDSETRTILTENAARLTPLTELNPYFATAFINSSMVQRQIETEKGTGGGVPKLALFRIEQLWMAWPLVEEQNEIAKRIEALDARLAHEQQSLSGLTILKAGLMDDLLTGRVRVTPLLQAEADAA